MYVWLCVCVIVCMCDYVYVCVIVSMCDCVYACLCVCIVKKAYFVLHIRAIDIMQIINVIFIVWFHCQLIYTRTKKSLIFLCYNNVKICDNNIFSLENSLTVPFQMLKTVNFNCKYTKYILTEKGGLPFFNVLCLE